MQSKIFHSKSNGSTCEVALLAGFSEFISPFESNRRIFELLELLQVDSNVLRLFAACIVAVEAVELLFSEFIAYFGT